jgi:hypothetical protein
MLRHCFHGTGKSFAQPTARLIPVIRHADNVIASKE